MSEFFAMDGYAAFIWPSYALTALGVIGLAVFALSERHSAKARLAREEDEASDNSANP